MNEIALYSCFQDPSGLTGCIPAAPPCTPLEDKLSPARKKTTLDRLIHRAEGAMTEMASVPEHSLNLPDKVRS